MIRICWIDEKNRQKEGASSIYTQGCLSSRSNIKAAATDVTYFARSKFSRSIVHKKDIILTWQLVFKLGYLFYKGGRIPLISLNELGEKSQATIILGKFVNKS